MKLPAVSGILSTNSSSSMSPSEVLSVAVGFAMAPSLPAEWVVRQTGTRAGRPAGCRGVGPHTAAQTGSHAPAMLGSRHHPEEMPMLVEIEARVEARERLTVDDARWLF